MNIVFTGAGNVTSILAESFKNKGFDIKCIFDIDIKKAETAALKVGADFTDRPEKLPQNSDLYVIAVNDNALPKVSTDAILKEKIGNSLVVHTSGSSEMSLLKNLSENYGVMYPLTTFSAGKDTNLSEIYFCLEADSEKNYDKIESIALKLSNNCIRINSKQRLALHLAAVFACNFTNHMFAAAEQIMNDNGLDFRLLLPLVDETAQKIHSLKPLKAQTGPAVRGDSIILEKHKEFLKNYPNLIKIYSFVSENIEKFTKKNNG